MSGEATRNVPDSCIFRRKMGTNCPSFWSLSRDFGTPLIHLGIWLPMLRARIRVFDAEGQKKWRSERNNEQTSKQICGMKAAY